LDPDAHWIQGVGGDVRRLPIQNYMFSRIIRGLAAPSYVGPFKHIREVGGHCRPARSIVGVLRNVQNIRKAETLWPYICRPVVVDG
jgi:hypothetical protein